MSHATDLERCVHLYSIGDEPIRGYSHFTLRPWRKSMLTPLRLLREQKAIRNCVGYFINGRLQTFRESPSMSSLGRTPDSSKRLDFQLQCALFDQLYESKSVVLSRLHEHGQILTNLEKANSDMKSHIKALETVNRDLSSKLEELWKWQKCQSRSS